MAWATVNGIRLYYQSHGVGPALVLAHGAGGNHQSWWQQTPFFSKRYRCVVFDQRAFGRTKDARDGPGRRAFADDLRELLDLLGIERTAIIAQSMGGRVSALVLTGTTGGAVSDAVRAAQEAHRSSPLGRRSLARRAYSPRLRQERPDLAYLYRLIGSHNPPRPKDFLAPIPGYRGSSSERLEALGIPILFLVGEDDAITPAHIIKMAHETVPSSQYDVIEGAGHSSYFERADAFNARVQRFLEEAAG